MRYAKIENGKVENVIVLLDEDLPKMPSDWTLIKTETANIGDDYINGVFVAQAPAYIEPTPEEKQRATIASIEADFKVFLDLKNIDSIGEASALLNSANVTWKSESQRAIELWDLTWLAFYNNEPLPLLTWL
jgi:hypothetical protein